MTDLYNISFAPTATVCLAIAAVLLLLLPFTFWLLWQKPHKAQLKIKYLLAGVIGFIVSARVLELGIHMLCIVQDNPVSRFINGSTLAFVIYGITMAGVFEECGRYIILKYIVKKDRTRENAVLYGIGHGGIEVLLVILPAIALQFYIALSYTTGDISTALASLKVTDENAAAILPTILSASEFTGGMLALTVIERIFAMFIHIGLTVIVFYGICENRKGCLPLAIVLHMIIDIFPALYQRQVIPMWLCEIWTAVWVAVIITLAARLYKQMK